MTANEYQAAANKHRPTAPAALITEMRRLAASGLTARDIAASLRLNLAYVVQTLAAPSSSAGRHSAASVPGVVAMSPAAQQVDLPRPSTTATA